MSRGSGDELSAASGDALPRWFQLGRVALLGAPIAIILGHLGADMPIRHVHISWYAARAPLGFLITLGMGLSTFAMLCAARAFPATLRPRWWAWGLAFFVALGSVGLMVLAVYEVDIERRIHNMGLGLFFFTTTPAMFLAGLTAALNRRPPRARLAGLFGALLTAAGVAIYLMWRVIRLERGVRQRLAFFLIWLAAVVLFTVMDHALRRRESGQADDALS